MIPHEGTVTMLFAGVESSTRHLLRLGDQYPAVLGRQRMIVLAAVERHQGQLVDYQDDSMFAAFSSAHDAVQAAIEAQRALDAESWPDSEPLRVRMGIHTGEPVRSAGGYTGLDVHRAARVCAAAHGSQIIISQTTRALILHALPDEAELIDLGHHVLKDLPHPEHLIQVAAPDLPREFPALRTLGAPAGVPPRRLPLIGRVEQIDACKALVLRDDIRLLSLTGPGGTGKTALAIHLAGELMPHFEDGVFYVALAAIADPALVPGAIARALGVQESGARPLLESLTDALAARHSLIVLDNFEHLLSAGAFVAALIGACPRLKCVITSREMLHVSLEVDVPVPPLTLPPPGPVTASDLQRNDAVQMFVARAQDVRPSFVLNDENAAAIAEICRRLDGLPLALELAAARIRLVPPRALLARLDRRLPMLTDGPRDRPARQRTLRDTVGWSYGLLSDEERRLFRLLGAFVGGFALDAVEAILGDGTHEAPNDNDLDGGGTFPRAPLAEPPSDPLDLIGSLVDKSLVRQSDTTAEPRFTLLETIREFALEQLDDAGETAEARRHHAIYYLHLAEAAGRSLIDADQVIWLDRLEDEYGNLTAALSWIRDAADAHVTLTDGLPADLASLRMAGALHWFWWLGGHEAEGRRWLAEALAHDTGEAGQAARARSLYAAGTLAMIQGSYQESYDLLDDGRRIAESHGDMVTAGRCLTYRGIVETYFHEAGNLDRHTPWRTAEAASAILEQTPDTWGRALAVSQLGAHSRRDGNFAEAERLLMRAVGLAREVHERYLLGSCLPKLGNLYLDLHDYAAAEPLYAEALLAFRELHENWWTGRCMQYLALAAHGREQHRRAALLIGGSDAMLERGGALRNPSERRTHDRLTDNLRAALGDATFTDTYSRGYQLSLDELFGLVQAPPTRVEAV